MCHLTLSGQKCDVAETRRAVTDAREGPAYKNNLELVTRASKSENASPHYWGIPVGPNTSALNA